MIVSHGGCCSRMVRIKTLQGTCSDRPKEIIGVDRASSSFGKEERKKKIITTATAAITQNDSNTTNNIEINKYICRWPRAETKHSSPLSVVLQKYRHLCSCTSHSSKRVWLCPTWKFRYLLLKLVNSISQSQSHIHFLSSNPATLFTRFFISPSLR